MPFGLEIIYPAECKPVHEEIKEDELRKRLNCLYDALLQENADQTRLNDSLVTENSSQDSHVHYNGLLVHLISRQFTDHELPDIRIRACACATAILNLICPHPPFDQLFDQENLKKAYLESVVGCIKLLNTCKNKTDSQFAFNKLRYLIFTSIKIEVFEWCIEVPEGEKLLTNMINAIVSSLKTIDDWAWTETENIISMFLNALNRPIREAEHLLTEETLTLILKYLVEPVKSTAPIHHNFARDFILRFSEFIDCHVQMLLQRCLVYRYESPKEPPALKSPVRPTSDHEVDLDAIVEVDEEEDRTMENEQADSEVEETAAPTDWNPLGEQLFQLIWELHVLQPSMVTPIIPSVGLKLRSMELKERKRSHRLLTRLFEQQSSQLHLLEPCLWEAYLDRFQDINDEMRKLCLHAFPRLYKAISGPALAQLLKCFKARMYDKQEAVRQFALKMVAEVVQTVPLDAHCDEFVEILVDRARDRVFTVRREAMLALGSLYKRILAHWMKKDSDNPQADEDRLRAIANCVLHMYYLVDPRDKIIVERVLKGSVLGFKLTAQEKVSAMILLHRLVDSRSLKAIDVLFRQQQKIYLMLTDLVKQLDEHRSRQASEEVDQHVMNKINFFSQLLPNDARKVDHLKKFFHQVKTISPLRRKLLLLSRPKLTCADAAKLSMELVREVSAMSARDNDAAFQQRVKVLLERAAPVLFDAAVGQELVAQLVVSRDQASFRSCQALDAPDAVDHHWKFHLAVHRDCQLLLHVAVSNRPVLVFEDVMDYLLGLLDSLASQPRDSATFNQRRCLLHNCELQVLILTVFCSMFGNVNIFRRHTKRAPSTQTAEGVEEGVEDSDSATDTMPSYLADGEAKLQTVHLRFLDYFLSFCTTGLSEWAKRANARKTKPETEEQLGQAYALEKKRAKLAVKALCCMLSVARVRAGDHSFFSQGVAATFTEAAPELRLEAFGDEAERMAHLERHILQLVSGLARQCSEVECESEQYVLALVTLGQLGLQLPATLHDTLSGFAQRIIQQVFSRYEERPGLKTSWTPDGRLCQSTRVKMGALKFLVNWLMGLHSSEKKMPEMVMKLLHMVLLHNGDLEPQSRMAPGDLARLRLTAGACMLKLAQNANYLRLIEPEHFQLLAKLIQDSSKEVRNRLAVKLNVGLLNFCLPESYLAVFALADESFDLEFKRKVRAFMTANIERRRTLLLQRPSLKENPRLFNAILPEYVLPHVIHLLAHSAEWKQVDDLDALTSIFSSIWFCLEPLMNRGMNYTLLRQIIETIKHKKDACCPTDPDIDEKIYICCDIALGHLITRTNNPVLKESPVDIKLPRYLFVSTPSDFKNGEFIQLVDCMHRLDKGDTDPSSGQPIAPLTFVLWKRNRTLQVKELVPQYLLRSGKQKKHSKKGNEEENEEAEEENNENQLSDVSQNGSAAEQAVVAITQRETESGANERPTKRNLRQTKVTRVFKSRNENAEVRQKDATRAAKASPPVRRSLRSSHRSLPQRVTEEEQSSESEDEVEEETCEEEHAKVRSPPRKKSRAEPPPTRTRRAKLRSRR